MGGFGLNATITGMLDTYNRAPGSRGRFRNSWLGGTQTAIPDVAQAMLLFEFGNPDINYVPGIADNATSEDESYLVYPPAIREFWARNLMQWDTCTAWDMNEISSEPDTRSTIGGGLTLGFTDGHAKFYSAGKFLSETPTYAEYIVGGSVPSSRMCGISSGTFAWDADVDLTVDYPMWGLGNN